MASEGATVQARCHSHSVIKLITDTLDEENLQLFRNGPFGHLLELQHAPQNFQCQLFHHCMKLLNQSKRRKGTLVFNFNNSEIAFGRHDFFLMSGLKFGPSEVSPDTSNIWTHSFDSTKCLTMRKVKQSFKNAKNLSPDGAGGGQVCLKLAHVLFVYGVLFPRDGESKKLDMKYLHVCDSMERVKNYPWGLESYNYFVDEFIKSADRMNRFARKDEKPNYEIFGFLFVFQSWLYEIFPSIALDCAERLEDWEIIYPRVLRWKTAAGSRSFDQLKALLAGASTVHPLIPSEEEVLMVSEIQQYLDGAVEVIQQQEQEHEGEDNEQHGGEQKNEQQEENEQPPAPDPFSVKRKLNLEPGDCSIKHKMKRRPGLRSAKVEVRLDEPPVQEAHEGDSEHSFPSISTPDSKERQFLKMLSSRLEKLEGFCSSMNQKCGCMNSNMKQMNEKMDVVLEFIHAFNRNPNMGTHKDMGETAATVDVEKQKVVGEIEDFDKLLTIPIVEITSDHPRDFDDVCNSIGADIRDDLDDLCLDENGNMRMVHEDASETNYYMDKYNEHPYYTVSEYEYRFLNRGEGEDDVVVDQNEVVVEEKEGSKVEAVMEEKIGSEVEVEVVVEETEESEFENDLNKLGILVDRIAVDNFIQLEAAVEEDVKQETVGVEDPMEEEQFVEEENDEVMNNNGNTVGIEQVVPSRYETDNRPHTTTRSNPYIVSSSSECSASLKSAMLIRNERAVGKVPSRLGAPEQGDAITTPFDPLKKYNESYVKPFRAWYKNPPWNERSFKLRSYFPYKVGTWFFEKLTMNRWLSTQNCDAILNLLLFKAVQKPNIFGTRWTVAENWFWHFMFEKNLTESNKKFLLRYPKGSLPELYAKPWKEVDTVFGIAHVFTNHFVAYKICIPEQEVHVYDSMSESEERWDELNTQFDLMSLRMRWICEEAGVSHFKGPVKDKWDVIENPDTPQQPNGRDCSIYSLKFIECLASGRPVSYLSSEAFSKRSRDYYCAEFFNSRVKDNVKVRRTRA